MAPTNPFTINDGPGKLELMLALFDHHNARPRHVQFSVVEGSGKPRKILDVMILSVEREDGSGESWNIRSRAGAVDYTLHYRSDKRSGRVISAGPACALAVEVSPFPFKLLNGPNKYDLMLGLFDHSGLHPRLVPLTIETPVGVTLPRDIERIRTNNFLIVSAEREDGSGESWNVIVRDQAHDEYMVNYNTRRNEGHIADMHRVAKPAA